VKGGLGSRRLGIETDPDEGVEMTDSRPDTILLIHGLWMTPRSWEKWAGRYEERGFNVLAPAWPGMEGEVEALNEDPTPIGELDIPTVVEHYAKILDGLDSPPIIMGHSFGGTFMQVLVDRGYGAAGVGVAAGTPKGVRDLPLSTLKATGSMFKNPFSHKAVPLDEDQFHYAFANTLTQDESNAIRDRYHVPGAASVLREGAAANLHRHAATEVDFEKPDRAPLLFVAFEDDHIVPPKASHHNAEHYKTGIVAFQQFDDRPHFPGVPGWEEVADFALDWALNPVATDSVEMEAAAQ
jgi:pimeloyl-ACP methyl ester carboxylesterase